MNYSLPHLHVIGTNYEIGLAIGKEFEKRIKTYANGYEDLEKKLLPFMKTEKGFKIANDFKTRISDNFPWLEDELRGLSDGSGIPFETILALNLRTELLHVLNQDDCIVIEEEGLECSNFSVCNNENYALLHNEDSLSQIYDTGYIVTCKIFSTKYQNGKQSPNEEFTSYSYPGHLAGNAFSFNSSGFVFAVNALYPKQIALNRFPRQIVSRLMLSARDLSNFEDIILNTPNSFSFSVTVGYFGDKMSKITSKWTMEYFEKGQQQVFNPIKPIIWNYEIAPNSNSNRVSKVSKHCVIPFDSKIDNSNGFYSFDHFYHFNHFERIQMEECVVHSSRHRRKRANEMKSPKNVSDLFELAYDSEDKSYPIFRDRVDNKIGCVATALFNLNEKKMSIYVNRSLEPLLSLLMEEKNLN